jgi:hypothetical protein
VRTTDRLRARLGQAEVLHLPRADELFDRTRNVLYGNVRIDPVLVEEIDGVDAQSPERHLGNFSDVLRTAIETGPPFAVCDRCRSQTWSQ